MARPKKDITRSEMVKVKLYPQEKKFIEDIARENNTSMSRLIRTGIITIYALLRKESTYGTGKDA